MTASQKKKKKKKKNKKKNPIFVVNVITMKSFRISVVAINETL